MKFIVKWIICFPIVWLFCLVKWAVRLLWFLKKPKVGILSDAVDIIQDTDFNFETYKGPDTPCS